MPKLAQYRAHKPCYFCGLQQAPKSTREHVPPEMMFTEFDCSAITVPSCDDHNSRKSGHDQAIIMTLIMGLSQMVQYGLVKAPLSNNVQLAIQKVAPEFSRVGQTVWLQPFLSDPPEGLNVDLPYIRDYTLIDNWIRQLTAALVWSVVGEHDATIQWGAASVWSPHFIPRWGTSTTAEAQEIFQAGLEREAAYSLLTWCAGWSAHPKRYPADIYHFELCFVPNQKEQGGAEVIFRHRFYNNMRWYVEFATSETTRKKLGKFISDTHFL